MDPYPQPYPRGGQGQGQLGSYVPGSDHPAALLGAAGSGSVTPSSDEDGGPHVRMIPIQRHIHTSSDESLGDGFLPRVPPKPAPRSPPQVSPTLEEMEGLGRGQTLAGILGTSGAGERSGRDSGISVRSPLPPPPPEEEYPIQLPTPSPPRPQQLFTSKLVGKFTGKDKGQGKKKPNFGKIFSTQKSSPEAGNNESGSQELDLDDLEEGPPRVRRPSGRFQHAHRPPTDQMELQRGQPPPAAGPLSISIQSRHPPPPLPSSPPPKLPSSGGEPLLRIQPLPSTGDGKKKKNKPSSLMIGTAEIPPPPPDSDEDNNNMATLPMHKSQLHYGPRSRAPYSPGRVPDVTLSHPQQQTGTRPLSPSRRSPFAGREPGITSYQDHFLYSSLHTETQTQTQSHPRRESPTRAPPPPPVGGGGEDDYGLPSPEEFFSSGPSRRSPSRPTPPTPTTSPVSESPRGRTPILPTTPVTSPSQRSAAEAVADLLTSRQPLSLRIHIQKHKTESSYKKTQTFAPPPKPSKGNGGKNSGGEFSESSI